MEILGNSHIFEIAAVNLQNAAGYAPKAKILEILRNLHIFEIAAVALQNMAPFASAGPREGLLYIGVEINLPSRGVQHWYTPTLLAPTHCAQTFLVVVSSVHYKNSWLCSESENIGNPWELVYF